MINNPSLLVNDDDSSAINNILSSLKAKKEKIDTLDKLTELLNKNDNKEIPYNITSNKEENHLNRFYQETITDARITYLGNGFYNITDDNKSTLLKNIKDIKQKDLNMTLDTYLISRPDSIKDIFSKLEEDNIKINGISVHNSKVEYFKEKINKHCAKNVKHIIVHDVFGDPVERPVSIDKVNPINDKNPIELFNMPAKIKLGAFDDVKQTEISLNDGKKLDVGLFKSLTEDKFDKEKYITLEDLFVLQDQQKHKMQHDGNAKINTTDKKNFLKTETVFDSSKRNTVSNNNNKKVKTGTEKRPNMRYEELKLILIAIQDPNTSTGYNPKKVEEARKKLNEMANKRKEEMQKKAAELTKPLSSILNKNRNQTTTNNNSIKPPTKINPPPKKKF